MVSASVAKYLRVVCYLPTQTVESADSEARKRGISRSEMLRRWLEPQEWQ